MKCNICNSTSYKIFDALVLSKHQVDYFQCSECRFIQTENPHWLQEAYSSPININDTGVMARNLYFSKITTVLFFFLFGKENAYLDYSGGYGIFTRIMRDIGWNYYWSDLYTKNIVARGFEYDDRVGVEAQTAFEVFEHFINPSESLKDLIQLTPNILFSTEIMPVKTPKKDWWYYGFEHGQHLSFYSRESLQKLAEQNNLYYYTNGVRLHLFTTQKLTQFMYSALIKSSFILFPLVTKLMKSKTEVDYYDLTKMRNGTKRS